MGVADYMRTLLRWIPTPRTPFLPSSHICYYNNKGQWRVLEVKPGDDLGSWLLLVLSIVTPTMSLRRRAPQVLMMEERRKGDGGATHLNFMGVFLYSFAGMKYSQHSRLRVGWSSV